MQTIYVEKIDKSVTTCPKCGEFDHLVKVEYAYGSPERYDGWSEWWCYPGNSGCGYREGRWTGFELHDGEIEPRLGQVRVKRKGQWRSEPAGKPVVVGADA